MRISDWSSDVCSSDLFAIGLGKTEAEAESQARSAYVEHHGQAPRQEAEVWALKDGLRAVLDSDLTVSAVRVRERNRQADDPSPEQIGRTSSRERVRQYV